MRRFYAWLEARPLVFALALLTIGFLSSEVGYALIGKGRPHRWVDSLAGATGALLGIMPIYLWRRHEAKRKSS